MKYTIETTDNGCVETFDFSCGRQFKKRTERTAFGCKAMDEDFADQLVKAGYDEEVAEKVYDAFDGFGALEFLETAELEK